MLMMKRHIGSFWALSNRRKRLLIEATFIMALVRPMVSVTFSRWSRLLGTQHSETLMNVDTALDSTLYGIRWAIEIVSRNVVWRADCFPKALTARIMLGLRRIPCTTYFGVRFTPDGKTLEAHAWVRAGCIIVTGAPAHETYKVVNSFTTNPQ